MVVVFRRYVAMKIEAQSPAIEPFVFSTFFLRNYNFSNGFFLSQRQPRSFVITNVDSAQHIFFHNVCQNVWKQKCFSSYN